MTMMNIVQAINQALKSEMEKDDRVILLGEDIGKNGGVFRATDQLFEQFGEKRVVDTPIAESAIIGAAVGMAARGLRPVAEIQFMGFIYEAMDQMAAQAARLRFRSGGTQTALWLFVHRTEEEFGHPSCIPIPLKAHLPIPLA